MTTIATTQWMTTSPTVTQMAAAIKQSLKRATKTTKVALLKQKAANSSSDQSR
jgi:hypothetical protein